MDNDNDNIFDLDPIRILAKAIEQKKHEITLTMTDASISELTRANRLAKMHRMLAQMQERYNTAVKREAKGAEAFTKASAEEAEMQTTMSSMRAVIDSNNYYYIQKADRYLKMLPNGSYAVLRPNSLRETHIEINDDDDKQLFKVEMAAQKRIFTTAVMTFGKVNPWEYNLLTRQHWIVPAPGEHHRLFDLLLHSLGGGRAENIAHLERCLAWKFRYPDDFMIPTPVIFGEGSVGKNLFFEEVAPVIFGDGQVGVIEVDNALGNFNGLLEAKAMVLMNEAVRDSVNMEKFKAATAAKSININIKYGLQYSGPSTAWIWCGGNGTTAGVSLANDHSDRRWSIIRVTHPLLHWVMESEGFPTEEAASEWFQRERHHLSDPEQVAHWMHALLERHKADKYRPRPLHGVDYHWLREQQKRTWEACIEAIVDADDFTHIHAPLLHRLYCWYHRTAQPASRYILKRGEFYLSVDEWLVKHRPDIERRQVKVVGVAGNYWHYMRGIESKVIDNSAQYEVYEGEDRYRRLAGYRIPGETLSPVKA